MVRVCSVYGCKSTSLLHKDLKFHRIPRDKRCNSWINACRRPYLKEKSSKQLYNMYVCSIHFEKWMYINLKLRDAAIPVLNLPRESIYPPNETLLTEMIKEMNSMTAQNCQFDVSSVDLLQTTSNDSTEEAVKLEVQEYFSEHEDDMELKWESRKRQHDRDPQESNKVKKTGSQQNPQQDNINNAMDRSVETDKMNKAESPQNPKHNYVNNAKIALETNLINTTESPQNPKQDDINNSKSTSLETSNINKTESSQNHKQDHMTKSKQETKKKNKVKSSQDSQLDNVDNDKARSPVNMPQSSVDVIPQENNDEFITVKITRDREVPRDFMEKIMNSQKEILSVLKEQVLLEKPNPELSYFLRLVGAKLSKLDTVKRTNLQDAIIDLIYKNN